MINKKLALKVKVKHLAEESRIIRKEEQKNYGDTREWLYIHRIIGVRPECRATHIAYAFAKGTELKRVERYPEEIPATVWARVTKMVSLYSDKSKEDFKDWIGSSIA
jgi:hypothetical protein